MNAPDTSTLTGGGVSARLLAEPVGVDGVLGAEPPLAAPIVPKPVVPEPVGGGTP